MPRELNRADAVQYCSAAHSFGTFREGEQDFYEKRYEVKNPFGDTTLNLSSLNSSIIDAAASNLLYLFAGQPQFETTFHFGKSKVPGDQERFAPYIIQYLRAPDISIPDPNKPDERLPLFLGSGGEKIFYHRAIQDTPYDDLESAKACIVPESTDLIFYAVKKQNGEPTRYFAFEDNITKEKIHWKLPPYSTNKIYKALDNYRKDIHSISETLGYDEDAKIKLLNDLLQEQNLTTALNFSEADLRNLRIPKEKLEVANVNLADFQNDHENDVDYPWDTYKDHLPVKIQNDLIIQKFLDDKGVLEEKRNQLISHRNILLDQMLMDAQKPDLTYPFIDKIAESNTEEYIKQLGKLLTLSLCQGEVDLKPDSFAMDKNNQIVKLDNDQTYVHKMQPHLVKDAAEKKNLNITTLPTSQDLLSLPKLSTYTPIHWIFDPVHTPLNERQQILQATYLEKLIQQGANKSHFEEGICEALYTYFFTPDEVIKKQIANTFPTEAQLDAHIQGEIERGVLDPAEQHQRKTDFLNSVQQLTHTVLMQRETLLVSFASYEPFRQFLQNPDNREKLRSLQQTLMARAPVLNAEAHENLQRHNAELKHQFQQQASYIQHTLSDLAPMATHLEITKIRKILSQMGNESDALAEKQRFWQYANDFTEELKAIIALDPNRINKAYKTTAILAAFDNVIAKEKQAIKALQPKLSTFAFILRVLKKPKQNSNIQMLVALRDEMKRNSLQLTSKREQHLELLAAVSPDNFRELVTLVHTQLEAKINAINSNLRPGELGTVQTATPIFEALKEAPSVEPAKFIDALNDLTHNLNENYKRDHRTAYSFKTLFYPLIGKKVRSKLAAEINKKVSHDIDTHYQALFPARP